MKHLMLYACLLIAIVSGIALFIEEPLTFVCWVGGWFGWLFFRCKIAEDDEPKGKPPVHNPRNKHPPTRMPTRYD